MNLKKRNYLLTHALRRNDAFRVAAKSATGFDSPQPQRRASAHRLMPAHFFRLSSAYACTQRSSFYGGRRREAFGPAGFLCGRSVNPASSVTLFDSGVPDPITQRIPPMRPRYRVARAQLRARHQQKRRQIDAALIELHACLVALHGAAGAIPSSIERGMLSEDGAYEILASLHERLRRAIEQMRAAVDQQGGAA
jgi:hypothetical protein